MQSSKPIAASCRLSTFNAGDFGAFDNREEHCYSVSASIVGRRCADADYEPSANQMSFEGLFMTEKLDLLVFVLLVLGCFRSVYNKEIQM